jgi:hypothetical protein
MVLVGSLAVAGGVGLGEARDTRSGTSHAKARLTQVVAAINLVRDDCSYYCGTGERCSSPTQHDMWGSGGGTLMTGDLHECQAGSCQGHGHEECDYFFDDALGHAWLDDLVTSIEQMERVEAMAVVNVPGSRVRIGEGGQYLQVRACSRVIAHVELRDH